MLAADSAFRADPGRDLRPPRGHGKVDLFVNHETSKVPFPYITADADRGQRRERLRQRAGQPAELNQHSAGVLNGSFAIDSSERLPALLLELPRHREGGLRPRHPLHERGDARLRDTARRTPGRHAIGDPAEQRGRRRRRARRRRPASTARSTAWAGTTTRTASRSRATASRSSSRATTRSRAARSPACLPGRRDGARPSRSSTRTSRRARTRCWPTRATCGRSSPTRRA